jgi:hypothetical protein
MQKMNQAAGIASLSLMLMGGMALAQQAPEAETQYEPPRTPWGDPDLQGIWPSTAMVGVPMTRDRALGERNYLTEEEFQERVARAEQQAETDLVDFAIENADETPGGAVGGPVSPPPHWLERGEPQYQASLIVDPPDGQYPATVAGAAESDGRRGFGSNQRDSYTDRSNYDRCISRGFVSTIMPVIYNNGIEIFQAPGVVAIRNEMIHEQRIIPLDGRPHADESIRMWMGNSRGSWEGNTLVIETRNLNDQTTAGGRTLSPEAVITERLRRINEETILYSMTIDDPTIWVSSWTFEMPLKLDNDYGMFEYACHEGNYAMFNILSGARAEERAAAEAAAGGE